MTEAIAKTDAYEGQLVDLLVYKFHGQVRLTKRFVIPGALYQEKFVGGLHPIVERIRLTPEQAGLTIDELAVLLAKDKVTRVKDETFAQTESDLERAAKRTERLNTLVGIIRTSDHEGERENAQDQYTKMTGRRFVA